MKSVQGEATTVIGKMETDYNGAMSSIGEKFITLDASMGELATGIRAMTNSGATGAHQATPDSQIKYKPITEYKAIGDRIKLGDDKQYFQLGKLK